MKQLLLFALLLPVSSYAQKGIKNEYGRKLYLCNNNRLEVEAEKAKPGSVDLMADNGKIIKDDKLPGVFYLRPDHEGQVNVMIRQWYTKNVARNDSVIYNAVQMPVVASFLVRKNKSSVPKAEAWWYNWLNVFGTDGGCSLDWQYIVDKFTVSIKRNDLELYRKNFQGDGVKSARWDTLTQDFIASLENGDRLSFYDIETKDCGGIRRLAPVELTISDAEKFHPPVGDTALVVNPITEQEEIYIRRERREQFGR